MTIGLVGRKVGMMRIFTDEGDAQPVTVLDVSDNRITQIKAADKDGNGKLDQAEAAFALPVLAARFAQLDANKDGYVTLDELAALMGPR